MKRIDSKSNAGYKALLALATEAREARKSGRAWLDGAHLVSAYRDKVGAVEQLLISESGLAHLEIAALAETVRAGEIIVLRDALFRELSGVSSPAGVAAVIAIPPPSADTGVCRCVILDGVQDPGNVGSILRTAAAAGFTDIFLGPGCAGVWTPRVLRAAQGAHFDLRLREQCDLTGLLRDYGGTSVAAVAAQGESIFSADFSGRQIAWVFGSEGMGLRSEVLACVQRRVTIPLASGSESLNVAAAAAICLFETIRQQSRRSTA